MIGTNPEIFDPYVAVSNSRAFQKGRQPAARGSVSHWFFKQPARVPGRIRAARVL